jgi:hypothetical protein
MQIEANPCRLHCESLCNPPTKSWRRWGPSELGTSSDVVVKPLHLLQRVRTRHINQMWWSSLFTYCNACIYWDETSSIQTTHLLLLPLCCAATVFPILLPTCHRRQESRSPKPRSLVSLHGAGGLSCFFLEASSRQFYFRVITSTSSPTYTALGHMMMSAILRCFVHRLASCARPASCDSRPSVFLCTSANSEWDGGLWPIRLNLHQARLNIYLYIQHNNDEITNLNSLLN